MAVEDVPGGLSPYQLIYISHFWFPVKMYLTVVLREIWNNLEMVGKNARTILKFQSLFYNYFSLNLNIQLKKVRVSQNSSIIFGLDFGLI